MVSESSKYASVKYHDIFEYPLKAEEIVKWQCKIRLKKEKDVIFKKGFYFLEGREEILKKRLGKNVFSEKKLLIAIKAAKVLGKIPYVRFVGITGALAMNNAGINSDIDLLVITQQGRLWTTRLLSYIALILSGYKIRNPNNKDEKDKLCLNMWLDESALIWNKMDRNIYTAHEIAQIVPLINKKNIYEYFIYKNSWIKKYWPAAVDVFRSRYGYKNEGSVLLEEICFKIQKFYMSGKMTREIATPHLAIFHPNDWGRVIIKNLE